MSCTGILEESGQKSSPLEEGLQAIIPSKTILTQHSCITAIWFSVTHLVGDPSGSLIFSTCNHTRCLHLFDLLLLMDKSCQDCTQCCKMCFRAFAIQCKLMGKIDKAHILQVPFPCHKRADECKSGSLPFGQGCFLNPKCTLLESANSCLINRRSAHRCNENINENMRTCIKNTNNNPGAESTISNHVLKWAQPGTLPRPCCFMVRHRQEVTVFFKTISQEMSD